MDDIFVLGISLIVYHTEITLNLNIIYAAKLYFCMKHANFFTKKILLSKTERKLIKN